ncbi:MAG: hypothetical protein U0790_19990 [Isosphaeraceae bacterium]
MTLWTRLFPGYLGGPGKVSLDAILFGRGRTPAGGVPEPVRG